MAYSTWDEAAEAALREIYYGLPDDYYGTNYQAAVDRGLEWMFDHNIEALGCWAATEGEFTWPEALDVLVSKQHDYGHDNINRFGLKGVEVRLWDKIARYKNLTGKRGYSAMNESVSDTLLDILGYVVLFIMVHDGTFDLPLAGDVVASPHTKWSDIKSRRQVA